MMFFRRIVTNVVVLCLAGIAAAQQPTGSIAGVIRDPSGAVVPGVRVTAVNTTTGLSRTIATAEQGDFGFLALPAGEYTISAEASGFQSPTRPAVVEPGSTTTTDLTLRVGDAKDSITVDGASPQLHYDSHAVGGVVTQSEVQGLPLNGRNFLELAKLEPGVQTTSRSLDGRTFLPVLGAPGGSSGRGTRVTIDGGSIMQPGYAGSRMSFSQEAVQEFQVSTVNFDLSTGITFSGAVNVVTRSGGNDLHGAAFYFFRDHKLSAYPALNRDPETPDPFFQRRQFGFALGGPIRHDRLFFFGNWDRNEQRGVVSRTLVGDFAPLSGITPSPTFGNLASLRLDAALSTAHTAFLRFSHDGYRSFAPGNSQATAVPSSWFSNLNWVDQSLLGLTSVFRSTLVNDLRFSYFFISASTLPAQQRDCSGCLGIGAPTINVQAGLSVGQSMRVLALLRRFQLTDGWSVQHGKNRTRFGMDWEHNRGGNLVWNNDPVTLTLFSPDQVRAYNARPQTPANLRIPLPIAFNTVNDILNLPLQSFSVGIGDPRLPEEGGGTTRTSDTVRLYFQDSWRMLERLTLNYGLAWNVDRNQNYDLSKPAFLTPILGANGLGPTRRQWKNFSPSLGLAWSPTHDRKTVIRAGAGIFYDFLIQPSLDPERAILGTPGLGRQNIRGSSVLNPLSSVPGVPPGVPLDFSKTAPTLFTGGDLMGILASIRADQQQKLAYTGDPSVRAIQITKQASSQLYPVEVPSASSQQVDVGVQRQVAPNFVVSADFAYRHFIHLGWSLDLNHFNSVRGPVISQCVGAQQNDPQAVCTTGPINVAQTPGRATYKGLLLRADKRFSHGFQFLGSYAYSHNIGNDKTNGFNLDNWLQNRGPLSTDFTHIVNLAGVARLPRGFEIGLNFSYSSAPPFSPYVGGIDFNGDDATTDDLLPGTTMGAFNRGLGRSDLARFVDRFNLIYAGTPDPHGRAIPNLTLPAHYGLDNNFNSLDLRITRPFVVNDRWRISIIGEVFNLYNKANLTGYVADLTSSAFGQPTSRATQVFGSGGPRAFQVATRVNF
jgi:hypothetical protein